MTDAGTNAGWWVLAVGAPYDPDDFDQREAARVSLRQSLLLAAIVPETYVWVWDETDRCQVLLRECVGQDEARSHAAALAGRGITVRVRRAMPE